MRAGRGFSPLSVYLGSMDALKPQPAMGNLSKRNYRRRERGTGDGFNKPGGCCDSRCQSLRRPQRGHLSAQGAGVLSTKKACHQQTAAETKNSNPRHCEAAVGRSGAREFGNPKLDFRRTRGGKQVMSPGGEAGACGGAETCCGENQEGVACDGKRNRRGSGSTNKGKTRKKPAPS